MSRRRGILRVVTILLLSCAAFGPAFVTDAGASVSIAVTWDDLLRTSSAAAVVTPVDAQAVWEGGRIYTYTRVHVDRPVAGELAGASEAWIRTMGGVVGKIGQLVEGEAVFSAGQPSLLFVQPGPVGAFVVTERAQGQFPVVAGADPKRPSHLIHSRATGALLAPRVPAGQLAADVLRDRTVDDVAGTIAGGWGRTHGP
jgi:hypothetical protein